MILDFTLLLTCHLTVLAAFPTSLTPLASSTLAPYPNNNTFQKTKETIAKRNRLFRQTDPLLDSNESKPESSSSRFIIGFKLEGDTKSIIENGLYVLFSFCFWLFKHTFCSFAVSTQ